MGEPGGLPSVGSHRVGHDWSDLAAAAAVGMTIPCNEFQVSLEVRDSPCSSRLHLFALILGTLYLSFIPWGWPHTPCSLFSGGGMPLPGAPRPHAPCAPQMLMFSRLSELALHLERLWPSWEQKLHLIHSASPITQHRTGTLALLAQCRHSQLIASFCLLTRVSFFFFLMLIEV